MGGREVPGHDTGRQGDPREWLQGAALDLYEHLDAVGEIRRLKQMPQLGAVAWMRPEAKHTRWDSVALALWQAKRIAHLDSIFGDYGKIEINGHRVGAGRDLMQCWIMLANCGHLWGSYATVKPVMDALRAPGSARDTFLRGLPTNADRAYAGWALDYYILYRLGLSLATGFIHLLPAHRKAKNRAVWLAMLRAVCEPGLFDYEVVRLYRVYDVLRRLAQYCVDLAHARLPVTMDISVIEQDPAHYLKEVVMAETGPLHALLDSLRGYVPYEVYLTPDVVLATRLLQLQAGPQVREDLNAAQSPEDLFARLHAMASPEAWPMVGDVVRTCRSGEYVHLHRAFPPQRRSADPKAFAAQAPRLQSRLTRQVAADVLVHVVASDLTERFIDFYVRRETGPADLARTLTVVCSQMTRPPASAVRSPAPRPSRGAQVRTLMTSLLSLMLRDARHVRVREYPDLSGDDAFLLVRGRDEARARRQVEQQRRRAADGPRRRALQALGASLRARPAGRCRAVMLNGFEVAPGPGKGRSAAELDGAYLDLSPGCATLYLVEAASTGDGSDAVRRLRGILRRLGWLTGSELTPLEGGAEAAVPVRLRARP